MPPTPAAISSFQQRVRRYFKKYGRKLPWRENLDPYGILVSELMLQQTQVDRVIPKYHLFLEKFPTFAVLDHAPLKKVLLAWQGLGYNRRALNLKKTAGVVISEHGGRLPENVEALENLPGIGPYTARAIAVFAFNQPHVLIETNIRTVFIHSFFSQRAAISDEALLPLIARTQSRRNPRAWYWALMDYGSYLKKTLPNPSRRSIHYTKQSSFTNSNRQLRGQILKTLAVKRAITLPQLVLATGFAAKRVQAATAQLLREELISTRRDKYFLG